MTEGISRIGNTNLFYGEALEKVFDDRGRHIIQQLIPLITGHGPKPVHRRLLMYQSLTEKLIMAYALQSETLAAAMRERAQLLGATETASRKRWTPAEDDALIEFAVQEKSMIELATTFNRSPGAITSRLTYLVGIQRVSKEVVGRLTGYLDGEPVTGHFEGTVTKE